MLVAFAVGVSGFFAGASAAQADTNNDIVFSDASFSHVYSSGSPVNSGSQVYRGDFMEFSVKYDATNANPVPGDSFTVTLPAAMDLRDTGVTQQLETADGVVAGECVLANDKTGSTITCTFNEQIKDKIDVKGSIKANLYVDGTTDSASVDVNFNGDVTSVPLPYGKPIILRPYNWQPGNNPGKYAEGVSASTTAFNWYIYAPGKWLNREYAAGSNVVITDNLTPGVLFPSQDMSTYHIVETCADSSGQGKATRVTNASQADGANGFKIAVAIADTHKVTITASGPWKNECDYQFTVRTSFANDSTIKVGYTYTNEATFDQGQTVKGTRVHNETFEGVIEYRDGFGGLKFVKRVEGDDAAGAANQAFTFSYTCSDGQSGSERLSQADGVKTINAQFAHGTTCTVTETGGERAGYTWTQPAAQTVTIVAGVATQVEFVNKYVKLAAVQPATPVINAGVCPAGATAPEAPSVKLPTTAGIKYEVVSLTTENRVVTATVRATALEGYTLDSANLGDGWTYNATDGTATWTGTAEQGLCSVAPVSPVITAGVCEEGASVATKPTVTVPTTTGLTYGEPTITVDGLKVTVTVVAKPEAGFKIDGDNLPQGWTLNADGTATFTVTENQAKCAVDPVSPVVEAGVCKPGSTTPSDPVVKLPVVPGLTYGTPKVEVKDGKAIVTVVATPDETRTIGKLTSGWTRNADGTATFTAEVKVPKCSAKPGLPKTGD